VKHDLSKIIKEIYKADILVGEVLYTAHVHTTQDDKHCPTAYVTIRSNGLNMVLNKNFIEGLTEPELEGILYHEAYHVLFGHLDDLYVRPSRMNRVLLNIVMDATINAEIKVLPKGCINRKDLPLIALGLESWNDFEVISDRMDRCRKVIPGYARLYMGSLIKLSKKYKLATIGQLREHISRLPLPPKKRKHPELKEIEAFTEYMTPSTNLSSDKLYDWMEQLAGTKYAWEDMMEALGKMLADEATHGGVGGGAGGIPTDIDLGEPVSSDVAKAVLEELVEEAIDKAEGGEGSGMGSGSGHLIRRLKEHWKQSRVDWRSEMRRFLSLASKPFTRSSWRKLNRRLGVRASGTINQYKIKIEVVVDTSGSVSEELLAQIQAELVSLSRAKIIDSDFYVVYGDASVQSEEKFSGKFSKIAGGGGTDMNPMIEYCEEKRKPDVILVCTDGYIPPLKNRALSRKLMWMIVGRFRTFHGQDVSEIMPGRVVQVDNLNPRHYTNFGR